MFNKVRVLFEMPGENGKLYIIIIETIRLIIKAIKKERIKNK